MKYIFILTIIFTSCIPTRKNEVLITDSDYAEFDRAYSPDSTMMLLSYGIDLGAFGYGRAGKAVLKLSDTTKNLRDFTLKNDLIKEHWINDDSISAKIDILPYVRTDQVYEIKNQKINGVVIVVAPYDYIDPDFEKVIEFRQKSPNGKYELIAYRYSKSRSALNFIHISIIENGQVIPKYGNYLIADMQSDYIFDGEWTSDNKLIFYTNELYADMVQYYLVENRPMIDYKLKVDNERFGSKYRWMKKGSN